MVLSQVALQCVVKITHMRTSRYKLTEQENNIGSVLAVGSPVYKPLCSSQKAVSNTNFNTYAGGSVPQMEKFMVSSRGAS
jgi:hypothetical protein